MSHKYTPVPAGVMEFYESLKQDPRVLEMARYRAHGRASVYDHSIGVANLSLWLAVRLHVKKNKLKQLAAAALLHDFYLYDYHGHRTENGFHAWRHPERALANAEKLVELNPEAREAIRCHMFPGTLFHMPLHAIGWVIVLADKACAICELLGSDKMSGIGFVPVA